MLLRRLQLRVSRTISGTHFLQPYCNSSSFFALPSRELISLRGRSTIDFLQGLITNDARLMETKNSLLYTLFLNTKVFLLTRNNAPFHDEPTVWTPIDGRVVSDAFIYHLNCKNAEDPHFVIECDSKSKPILLTMLRYYNIRKKVHISEETSLRTLVSLNFDGAEQKGSDALFIGKDPRAIPNWCWRMLHHSSLVIPETICATSEALYRRARFYLGLPEGPEELKFGEGLPLEANADLCHGVSFSKGCYVGQELTARSRFIGVIRRRVAPILFESPTDPDKVPIESPIYRVSRGDQKVIGNRPVGWIRGVERSSLVSQPQQYGLALLRLADCAAAVANGDILCVSSSAAECVGGSALSEAISVFCVRPFAPSWWPKDIAIGLPRIHYSLPFT